ncbi:hypothetical protein [Pseudomonas sp. LP_7_YM]|uniref:hypothetical protein n=1 Tax=Pseudomonas sp. LP_7_YM TaxID=2485137 RepID=UPI00105D0425|nr:hypothetical protein [Pseudomonas sp. LP_7_YM]
MALILLSLITLVITTCVARRRIDTLLSRCTVVADHKATFGGLGFIEDVIRVGTVCTILLIPKAYARKNFIDEEQVQEFPSGLRFLIVSAWSLIFIAALALVAFRFYMYLYDIHPSGK